MGGNAFLMPFFLESCRGLSTGHAGLILMVYSVTFMTISPLAGRLADRVSPWRLCAAGMGTAAASSFLFSRSIGETGVIGASVFLAGLAVAYALFMASNAKEVLGTAPVELKGEASAVYGTLYNLGLLLGVNAFETLYAEATAGPAGALSKAAGEFGAKGVGRAYAFGACACLVSLLLASCIPILRERLGREGRCPV
jgi:predicted MFS family arabinose efflux permease